MCTSFKVLFLLALGCEAASSEAPHRRLGLSSRGRHLQALRHRRAHHAGSAPAPAAGGVAKLTQAQEFVKADQEATADFVRRCEVVVTVSDDKFLPVKPLDRFCQTTDAAMECRLKVGKRLKDTHARDGDMGRFCGAVYDWFQGKYGMKCPQQCRKLQCKSTCMWLEAKKKLNKDNVAIKDEMEAAEKSLSSVKGLAKQVSAKAAEVSKQEFSIKMLKVKVARVEKTLAANKDAAKDAAAKKLKVDTSAGKLETSIAAIADSLSKRDDSLMKQKFAIDKAKLSLQNMARTAARDMDKAKEDRAESESLTKEAKKLSDALDALVKQTKALKDGIAKDKAEAAKQDAVFKKKIVAVQKAEKQLDEFKVALLQTDAATPWEEEYHSYMFGNYKSDSRVNDIKELVENQYKRAKAAESLLEDINKKIRDANNQVKELDADTARLTKQKEEATALATVAVGKAEALEKAAKEAVAKASTFKASKITAPEKTMKTAQDVQNKEKASKAKAEKTLKFMGSLVEEQNKKVAAANGAVKSAEAALEMQKSNEAEAEATLKTLTDEKAALEKKEKDDKAALAKNEKDMMGRIKGFKAAQKDLDMHKPEIVAMHSLQP